MLVSLSVLVLLQGQVMVTYVARPLIMPAVQELCWCEHCVFLSYVHPGKEVLNKTTVH